MLAQGETLGTLLSEAERSRRTCFLILFCAFPRKTKNAAQPRSNRGNDPGSIPHKQNLYGAPGW